MKRPVFLILCIFLLTVSAGAFETYVSGSKLVYNLNDLYVQAGRAFPTASFPVDKAELYSLALDLRRSADSRALRAGIDDYLAALNYAPEEREVVSEEGAAYEHYFRGAEAVYTRDYDYFRSYMATEPFLTWALSAGSDGKTGIHVSAEIKQQADPDVYPDTNLFSGWEGNPVAVENYFITTGYFTHRSGDLLLQLGRTPVHFGAGDFSSMLPSDRLPYLDAFYYTWTMGPLKMSSFFSSLCNQAGDGEEIPDAAVFPDIAFDSTMILAAMHRFEWAFERLRLGITGLHFSSRENNAFHLGDIFPVFSWHNGQVGVHNMSLVFEAGLVPFKGLELFAQAGYDDINSEDISGVGDTDIPTIPAYILGAKYTHAPGNWKATYLLEGGYTHYLWGNFHEFDPNKGNYLSRAIYRYLRDEEIILLPMTSPFGPGTIWLRGDADIQFHPAWSAGVRTETVFKNTRADLVTTRYRADEEVADAAMELWGYYALRADYTYKQSEKCRFSIYMEPAIVVRDTTIWPELSIGINADLIHRAVIE